MIEVCCLCVCMHVNVAQLVVSAWWLEWVIECVCVCIEIWITTEWMASRNCFYFYFIFSCFVFIFMRRNTDAVSHSTNGNFFCFQQIDSGSKTITQQASKRLRTTSCDSFYCIFAYESYTFTFIEREPPSLLFSKQTGTANTDSSIVDSVLYRFII